MIHLSELAVEDWFLLVDAVDFCLFINFIPFKRPDIYDDS